MIPLSVAQYAPTSCTHLQLVGRDVHQVGWSLVVVLLPGTALLLVDGITLGLGETQEAADHREILPERAVLWGGILFPPQELTEPALMKGFERKRKSGLVMHDLLHKVKKTKQVFLKGFWS